MAKLNTKNRNRYLTTGLVILSSIFVIIIGQAVKARFKSQQPIKQNSSTNSYQLKLGNFSVAIPNDYILSQSKDYSSENYGKVSTSQLKDESGCVRVEGVDTTILERNISLNTGYSIWHPVIQINAWNINNLEYIDTKTEKNIQSRFQKLANLSNLSLADLNKDVVASFKSNLVVPTFDPFEGYLTCAGIYKLPTFLEKQTLTPGSKWKEVFYGEVYEGNGDTFGAPVRVLLANYGSNWIVVKEQQSYPVNYKSKCVPDDLSIKAFNCVRDEWSNLRNSNDYHSWAKEVLSWIN